ncbi:hypothetical protein [Frankia sp. Cr1]|uniref:hypothetical protein n=1 Tax=Frankia sp. Cr1 TaxID=3073931 RepID=UPI002AD44E12|nr:hypothetical protein [Frankia sp. Cr1]
MNWDWDKIINTANKFFQDLNDATVINGWLGMDDDGAYASIKQYVLQAGIIDIDRMDEALFTASTSSLQQARPRVVKFYTLFKIVETVRFDQFRGFPI